VEFLEQGFTLIWVFIILRKNGVCLLENEILHYFS
jgi:hypothetical protein